MNVMTRSNIGRNEGQGWASQLEWPMRSIRDEVLRHNLESKVNQDANLPHRLQASRVVRSMN